MKYQVEVMPGFNEEVRIWLSINMGKGKYELKEGNPIAKMMPERPRVFDVVVVENTQEFKKELSVKSVIVGMNSKYRVDLFRKAFKDIVIK